MNKYLCGNKLLMYVCICVWKGCLLVTWKDERYTDFMYSVHPSGGTLYTVSENNIGAPKMRNDYDVIQLSIFQQFWKQYWTFLLLYLKLSLFFFFASLLLYLYSINNDTKRDKYLLQCWKRDYYMKSNSKKSNFAIVIWEKLTIWKCTKNNFSFWVNQ